MRSSIVFSIALTASSSKGPPCGAGSSLLKALLHERCVFDRPRGPTAPPHARRSVAREGTARRARVPSVDSVDDPVLLDRHQRFYATCTRVDGTDRRHPHADTNRRRGCVITIAGIGDHLRPEWLITITGIWTVSDKSALTLA